MSERFSKQVAEKMGYTPISEAIRSAERAAKEAKIKTVEALLYGMGVTYFTDATIVHAWERVQKTPSNERIIDPEWRIIAGTIRSLEKIGGKMIGFDIQTGPQIIEYDPNKVRKVYDAPPEGLIPGTRVKVVVPGLEVDGEVIRYPIFEKI